MSTLAAHIAGLLTGLGQAQVCPTAMPTVGDKVIKPPQKKISSTDVIDNKYS
jgi:hypothetical protein